jgi:hypothetical protein
LKDPALLSAHPLKWLICRLLNESKQPARQQSISSALQLHDSGVDWVQGGGDHGDPDLRLALSTLKDEGRRCVCVLATTVFYLVCCLHPFGLYAYILSSAISAVQ